MSISVRQEEAKFRPVTIVVDDVRTANLLRFVLNESLQQYSAMEFDSCVSNINGYADAVVARDELVQLHKSLQEICK